MIGTSNVKGDIIYINLERKNQMTTKAVDGTTTQVNFGKGATYQPLKGTTSKLNNRR